MSQLDICRGDVVLVPFPYISDFTKAKTRPALVIQNDIGNFDKAETIITLPKRAILKKVGHLPSQAMKEVNEVLAISLDLKLAE